MGKQLTEPEWIYHYTSHEAFHSIIESSELWAHDFRLANDRREIDYAAGLFRRALDNKTAKKYHQIVRDLISVFADPFDPFKLSEVTDYIAAVSFSEEENQLSQWRAYAPDSGYSLGFDRGMLFSIARDQGFEFGRVLYDFNKQTSFIAAHLRNFLQRELEQRSLRLKNNIDIIDRFTAFYSRIAPLIKHDSFYEEREWRIFRSVPPTEVQFYSGKSSIRPYVPIKLAEPGGLIRCLRADPKTS
jgi:hypothetical protein